MRRPFHRQPRAGGSNRRGSSQNWVARQARDPFVKAAASQNFRSRAAFKLAAVDKHKNLIRPGQKIADLGAAPGGFSQYAAQKTGTGGLVVAADLLPIQPIPGVATLQIDLTQDDAPRLLLDALGGQADLVLSDLAPKTSGNKDLDQTRSDDLSLAAARIASQILQPGGQLLLKARQGGESQTLAFLSDNFTSLSRQKPPASRSESPEFYFLAAKTQ